MAARPGPPPAAVTSRPRLLATLLFLVSVYNFIDRQILTILAEPIRRDLALSDAQLGLLTGLAFSLFYAISGIPIAKLIDRPRIDRMKLLSVALAFWTLMTMAAGLTQNFIQLLLVRMGVGLGEAACGPTSHAIIGDAVPPERRARAVALFGLGVPTGTLLGLALGGLAADMFGWRMSFVLVGLPGLFLSVVLWFLLPDVRPPTDPAAKAGRIGPLLRSRTYLLLVAAIAGSAFISFGQGLWTAVLLIRGYDLSPGTAGIWLGLVGGTAGAAGTWLGGVLGDRWGAHSFAGRLRPCVIAMLLLVPLDLLAFGMGGSWPLLLVLLWLPLLLMSVMYGPSFAAVQALCEPSQRGMGAAMALFAVNILGLGLGPFLYGVVSDVIGNGPSAEGVRGALQAGALFALVPAGLFWLAGRSGARA